MIDDHNMCEWVNFAVVWACDAKRRQRLDEKKVPSMKQWVSGQEVD